MKNGWKNDREFQEIRVEGDRAGIFKGEKAMIAAVYGYPKGLKIGMSERSTKSDGTSDI